MSVRKQNVQTISQATRSRRTFIQLNIEHCLCLWSPLSFSPKTLDIVSSPDYVKTNDVYKDDCFDLPEL